MPQLLPTCDRTVLVIGDLHHPFAHPDALAFLQHTYAKYDCDTVVNIGDEIDAHALGAYDVDPDGFSPGEELCEAVEALKPFYDAFPDVLCCFGNHTIRVFKKAFKSGLPSRVVRELHQILEAPDGWKWADSHDVGPVRYEHGESYGGEGAALKHARANLKSTVIGHHHSLGGVAFTALGDRVLFGLSAGCLIDHDAYCFRYAKHVKQKPVLGCGVVVRGVPVFVPMRVDRKGRWVTD